MSHIQMSVEKVVERGARERRPSSIRELLRSPVREGRRFIVKE